MSDIPTSSTNPNSSGFAPLGSTSQSQQIQPLGLPIPESPPREPIETQLSATQDSRVPETLVRESFVPETILPIAGSSGPIAAQAPTTIGDGTMDVDENSSGPSTLLGGVVQSVTDAIAPVVNSVLPAFGAVLPTSTSEPTRQATPKPSAAPSHFSAPNGRAAPQSTEGSVSDLARQLFPPRPVNAIASSSSSNTPAAEPISREDAGSKVPVRYSSPFPPARPRTYRTGYIYDTAMMLHCVDGYQPTDEHVEDAGDGHPEEPMRIKRIYARLKEAGLVERMKELAFRPVSFGQVMLVHSEEHWCKVEGTQGLFYEHSS